MYRAYDPVLERDVALKVPRAVVLENPEARARFLREPKAAAQLRHPHIVPVYDAGSEGEQYYIASTYVDGRTLRAVIAEERPGFRESAQLVRDLAEALDYAHRKGVIHRDVKPANIMINGRGRALLMDFGLARLECEEEKLTHDGTMMGTPAYMAPEQADRKFGEVGPASDQYALGTVLYELLCGETPFSGPPAVLIFNTISVQPASPRTRNPAVPKDLETVCLKALRKEPRERYGNCGELADDLQRWLEDKPIRARRMTVAERSVRFARRNPVLAALGALAVFLAIVSTAACTALFLSRGELVRALEDADRKTESAQREKSHADEETRVAREEEIQATKKEQFAQSQQQAAKEAMRRLEEETAARNKLEAEASAALEKRLRLAQDLEKTKSQASSQEAAATETKKRAETVEQSQAEMADAISAKAEAASWSKYTESLKAADAAIRDGKKNAAVELLQACASEHRSWEWDLLLKTAKGSPPKTTVVELPSTAGNRGKYGSVFLEPQGTWASVGLLLYRIPSLQLDCQMPVGVSGLSPDGAAALVAVARHGGKGLSRAWGDHDWRLAAP